MISYECEDCGKTVYIDKSEALYGHNEPYEFNQCEDCFNKGL